MSGFPFDPPISPMEARVRTSIPQDGWAYEPKWDGFRCVAWAGAAHGDGSGPRLDSRNHRPLLRYFPELRAALEALPEGTVVDGEVVVVRNGQLDFDALQQRLHPAESRVATLSVRTPAELVAFDLLALEGVDLRSRAFRERRAALMGLLERLDRPWRLTPSTTDPQVAARWFVEFESAGCDGIVAKPLDEAYREGERAMAKIKHRREVDCVVGGYRLHKEGDRVGSLLLGLYTQDEQLHFIGHCSGFSDTDRKQMLTELRELETADAFGQGVRRPGEASRWSAGKDLSWVPLRPELVCTISYDQLTGERFRHATRFERWRGDKEPLACTFDQLASPEGPRFADIVDGGGPSDPATA